MESIILLHGALGAAHSMLPLSKALSSFGEVHVLNFSGHGDAAWPGNGFSMETFEQDVLKLMDDQGLAAAHFFGYSMGGFVALRLAMRLPERVSSVTTLATKLDWTEETCAREAGGLDAGILEAKAPKFTAMLAEMHTRNGWRQVMAETQTMLQGMSRYRIEEEAFGKINVRIRLMVGDRDKMVRMDETLAAYRALPNGELAVLPRTAHPLEAVSTDLLAAHICGMIG